MPVEIIWEPRGVYRRYFGRVTIEERRRSFDEICADPRFDALRHAITDYLDVDDYEITDQATKEIAALHIGPWMTNPNVVIAAVVVNPQIVAAIEHFISLKFAGHSYRIFPTLAAARAWTDSTSPTSPTSTAASTLSPP